MSLGRVAMFRDTFLSNLVDLGVTSLVELPQDYGDALAVLTEQTLSLRGSRNSDARTVHDPRRRLSGLEIAANSMVWLDRDSLTVLERSFACSAPLHADFGAQTVFDHYEAHVVGVFPE